MTETITFNTSKNRYEMDVSGEIVFADIRRTDGITYIQYVEAPHALRGTGAAGRFMKGLMDTLRSENAKVIPVCGYAAGWIQRHAEYNDMIG